MDTLGQLDGREHLVNQEYQERMERREIMELVNVKEHQPLDHKEHQFSQAQEELSMFAGGGLCVPVTRELN